MPAFTRTQLFGSLGLAAGALFVYAWDPAASSLYPHCPVFAITGWQCPGCGATRSLHALLHGEFASAWRMNPLLVASLPLASFLCLPQLRRVFRTPPLALAALALTCAYGLLRNLT